MRKHIKKYTVIQLHGTSGRQMVMLVKKFSGQHPLFHQGGLNNAAISRTSFMLYFQDLNACPGKE